MKQVKLFAIATLLLLLCPAGIFAQKNYMKDADNAYDAKQYYNAIELYKKAMAKIKKPQMKARCTYQVAQCYRFMNDWRQAETWYAKAIKAKYDDDRALLYLAEAKKFNQKYDEAIVEFKKYQAAVNDPAAANGIKSCEMAQKWKDNPTCWKVENMAQINTKEYDFAPMYSDKRHNALVITSKREGQQGGGKVDPNTGMMYSDLFETRVDKNGKWSQPTPLNETVNTHANEGACFINKKADKMFFTRCGVEKKKTIRCKIFMTEKKGNAWGEAQIVDFGLEQAVLDSFNFRHPTLSPDETTMIFSSDMLTGNMSQDGTSDLWMSTYDKKAKRWSKPVNLGAGINTAGREGYPFVREDGTLYFSSDGHIGMGGLDIFSAARKSNDKWEWATVSNMQYPLNSSGDDFGIIFDGKKDRGFLTSNREGTKGADDVWSFQLPAASFQLEGKVSDCEFNVPIENAVVRLLGSDGSAVEATTNASGAYSFKLLSEVSYVITVLADKAKSSKSQRYLNLPEGKKMKLTTIGESACDGKTFVQDCCLPPVKEEIEFPAVLYDIAKATLKPESKDSLNFLYQTLMENPTLVIELAAHTDSRASDSYNLRLSQARAQACVDYLVNEKGVKKERLIAKGYGEKRPLRLPDGTVLTEKYINSKKSAEERDKLHALNRRTVFSAVRWDYVDPNGPKLDRSINPPKVKASMWDGSGEEEPEEKKD